MNENKPRKVHVETVTRTYKGKVYKSVLLRRTYREDGKVKHETVGNLSDLSEDTIDYIKRRLAGESPLIAEGDSFRILRSLPHGNVAAVLGTAKNVGLDKLIVSRPCRELHLVMAMIVDRIISPGSKLSCIKGLQGKTAQNTLSEELCLGDVDVHELYAAMDWLLARQTRIENKLAKKHLAEGTLVLFDLSSSFCYGRKSELVKHGYSRDHRSDRPQITYGLLCDPEGRPIAVEVLPGNTSDPKAFTRIVERVRKRFGIKTVVFVGDRGMITSARINEDLRDVEGLDWISALRTEGIRKLVDAGYVSRSLFDECDLAEITAEDLFPGERLVVCRNPILAEERARKREDLLTATEEKLEVMVRATQRKKNALRGEKEIGLRVGKVIGRYKMEKHFELTITANSFAYARRSDKIAAEAALDGLYVVRASVPSSKMGSEQVVETYKSLATVERAFRSMKTVDLHVRPIFHWTDDRIRAHVFLCMLAYYVEWHMRQRLKEVLYEDDDRESAKASRKSIVAPAVRSESAKKKDATGRNESNLPVQSFQDLLKDLATLSRNRIRLTSSDAEFLQLTESTTLQRHVLELLAVIA
jgi:transposase